jgi:epoxide hydrolase-like predicted phosphatase
VPLEQINALVFDSPSALRALVGELTIGQHWQEVGVALGLPPAELPGFVQQFWSADELNDEVVELLRSLRPRYKIGLLSNAWDDLRQTLDERFHVVELFDELIISAEVGLGKPDPRIYQLAVQRLGVQPAEAVFIDDVLVNVEAARGEGLYAIQFLSFEQAQSELSALLAGR